jgi:hypothetical protein
MTLESPRAPIELSAGLEVGIPCVSEALQTHPYREMWPPIGSFRN